MFMLAVVACSVITSFPTSFQEQIDLFSSHGVIVSPHGAGLMNLFLTAPFSAVVEIFPYQTHHSLYALIAANLGIAHYPVHTYNGSTVLSNNKVRVVHEPH